jgi:predicted transcriptional regulator
MSDDELMARLRRIADEVDGPPDLVAESARAAFSMRRLDEEIAELLHDSDRSQGQLVRGETAGPRALSFRAAAVSIEVQIEVVDDRVALSGVVTGASGDATIESTTEAAQTVRIDKHGWFRIGDLPVGPLRVRLTADDGGGVTSSWFTA